MSVEYYVVWLGRRRVHGWVVAHVCKGIRLIVTLYVDVVLVCGCGAQVAVPRCPSYRQVFGGYAAVARVAVVLVRYCTLAGNRSGLHHPLVVEHNLVPWLC